MGANKDDAKRAWDIYRERELAGVIPYLQQLGFTIDTEQPHLGGERYLMAGARDIGGGGLKLVLMGKRSQDGARVVIKASSEKEGIKEIERERQCRVVLHALDFAMHAFFSPEEILFEIHGPYRVYVTTYIEQTASFVDHKIDEQFFLALRALEAQEGVHATTHTHRSIILDVFGMESAEQYLRSFEIFRKNALAATVGNAELAAALERARELLYENKTVIERYCGFLTHSDFVPNNVRIHGRDLYLLDYASLHFGNKYESWARFINFMVDHNPPLGQALTDYVRKNRGEEEYLSLRLMRVYKLAFLLQFWSGAVAHASGDLAKLAQLRIWFWTQVLIAVLDDTPVSTENRERYLEGKDRLRSEEEKVRQRELLGRQ